MPSASTKSDTKASQEVLDPIKIALQVVDKKVRNLEKRKGKLDGYRQKLDAGEKLNEDQKEAIARYDGVVANLEFGREMQKQFLQINTDGEKVQKKQLKRERAERMVQDLRRMRDLLNIQNILDNMGGDQVREDFTEGRHGAVKLTEDNLNHLDELYKLVSPTRETEQPSFGDQLTQASEHLTRLLDFSEKPVLNTTFKELREILDSIQDCGYFNNMHNKEEEKEEVEVVEEVETEQMEEPTETEEQEFVVVDSEDVPEPESAEVISSLPLMPQTTEEVQPEMQQSQEPQPGANFVDDSFFSTTYANKTRPFSEIVSSVQGNFNFLQDSEIDMDAPQMDPAVVALAPPPIPHPPSQQSTESSLTPQSYGQGLLSEEQQQQQQQQVSQNASLAASQQVQVTQQPQQQATPPPQQYTTTTVSQTPSSLVNQADLENTYSAPSDYSQTLMSQNLPASALHSTQLADSTSQISFGSMADTPPASADVPPAIPMPNQTPYGSQSVPPSQSSLQGQSNLQNQTLQSAHTGFQSAASVNQAYTQQQANELSQTETKKFSMNANAAVFQSMYHPQLQQSQPGMPNTGAVDDSKADSQQQNDFQSNTYGNAFPRGGGNRGNSRGSYNGRGGRGMSNGFRGNSRGGSGQYNNRGGSYSNGRGNSRGAMRGGPPRGGTRGGRGSFNGSGNRSNMGQQQQQQPQQASA